MKQSEIIIALLLGMAAGLWWRNRQKAKATTSAAPDTSNYATLITEYQGWRYYTDGTVIDPQGRYYSHGDLAYTPPVSV